MPKRVPCMWCSTMSTSLGSSSFSVVRSPVSLHVAVDGVEEPQRGIGRVVQAFLLAFGKHVGDQAVADVMGEGAQNPAGLAACGRW